MSNNSHLISNEHYYSQQEQGQWGCLHMSQVAHHADR